MKVTLTSGAEVEMRGSDELTARDKSVLYNATKLPSPVSADGEGFAAPPMVNMGLLEQQTCAVLAAIITRWTYPYPLPKDDGTVDMEGNQLWDESLKCLPIDDWNELEEAVAPHMAKLRGGSGPKGRGAPGTSSTSNGTSRARASTSRKVSPKTS